MKSSKLAQELRHIIHLTHFFLISKEPAPVCNMHVRKTSRSTTSSLDAQNIVKTVDNFVQTTPNQFTHFFIILI